MAREDAWNVGIVRSGSVDSQHDILSQCHRMYLRT